MGEEDYHPSHYEGHMRKRRRLIAASGSAVLVLVAVAAVAWLVGASIQGCLGGAHVDNLKSRIDIFRICTGGFLHENGEAITAVFTVVLAISTILLWRSTRSLWKAGEEQLEVARETAEAATLNAKAAIAMQVPYIICRLRLFRPQPDNAEVTQYLGDTSNLRIGLEVVGNGIAEVIGIRMDWTVVKALSDTPQYKSGHNIRCDPGSVLWNPGNPRWEWSHPHPLTLQEDEIAAISEGTKYLWVFGYVSFNDSIGNPHETRFCARWQPFHPRPDGSKESMFIYDENTPASYSRKT